MDLQIFSVKDKLFLLRAAEFYPLGWSGLFPSDEAPEVLKAASSGE